MKIMGMGIVVFWLLLSTVPLALDFLIVILLHVLETDLVLPITPVPVEMATMVHNVISLAVLGLFKQILEYVLGMEHVLGLTNAFANLVTQGPHVYSLPVLDYPQLTQLSAIIKEGNVLGKIFACAILIGRGQTVPFP